MNYSKVLLVGRLTRTPELKEYAAGKFITSFTIAVNDKKDEASFIDCKAFDFVAQQAGKLQKGTLVNAEGALRQERWLDKETGKERSKLVVIVSMIGDIQSGLQQSIESKPQETETPEQKMARLMQEVELPF